MIKLKGVQQTLGKIKTDLKAELNLKKELKKQVVIQKLKAATPIKTGRARAGWTEEGDSIVNTVPYVPRLNQGSSKQAKPHFIEQVILDDPDLVVQGVIIRYK